VATPFAHLPSFLWAAHLENEDNVALQAADKLVGELLRSGILGNCTSFAGLVLHRIGILDLHMTHLQRMELSDMPAQWHYPKPYVDSSQAISLGPLRLAHATNQAAVLGRHLQLELGINRIDQTRELATCIANFQGQQGLTDPCGHHL